MGEYFNSIIKENREMFTQKEINSINRDRVVISKIVQLILIKSIDI